MPQFKVGDEVKVTQGPWGGEIGFISDVGEVTALVQPMCYWLSLADLELVDSAQERTPSNVNSPSHYNESGIECIEAIRATLGPEGFQAYCKGNVMKYLWRYEYKNGLEDLEKAQVYLGWMVDSMKQQSPKD